MDFIGYGCVDGQGHCGHISISHDHTLKQPGKSHLGDFLPSNGLGPHDKAEAITVLYEMYLNSGKKPEERTTERMLRLVA